MAYDISQEGITAGGFDEDEDQISAPSVPTAGGMPEEDQTWSGEGQQELDYLDQLKSRAEQSGSSAYGQNAAARWTGTPAVGLSLFAGHRQDRAPSFNARGQLRGFRSAPGAPQAQPPEGLIGGRALQAQEHGITGMGASLTPTDQWRKMFPTPGLSGQPLNNGRVY